MRCSHLIVHVLTTTSLLSNTCYAEINEANSVEEFSIPIELRTKDDGIVSVYRFNRRSNDTLEHSVAAFCEKNDVRRPFCIKLMERALQIVKEMRWDTLTVDDVIPYPHLRRHQEASYSETLNRWYSRSSLRLENEIFFEENRIDQLLSSSYSNYVKESNSSVTGKVIFIHSCSLEKGRGNLVLFNILNAIARSGLIVDRIWVLNYGDFINGTSSFSRFQSAFPNNNKVIFIQRSSDVSFFEVPTLRHLWRFSRVMLRRRDLLPIDPQILYLHTKGVSYAEPYPQIQDWTNMMLYFLVEKHSKCHHLLLSGEFDTLGCNYMSLPRAYRGNMWWALASYLVSLPLLPMAAEKYMAEMWIFNISKKQQQRQRHTRMYALHESGIDHGHYSYPREMYAEVLTGGAINTIYTGEEHDEVVIEQSEDGVSSPTAADRKEFGGSYAQSGFCVAYHLL